MVSSVARSLCKTWSSAIVVISWPMHERTLCPHKVSLLEWTAEQKRDILGSSKITSSSSAFPHTCGSFVFVALSQGNHSTVLDDLQHLD